MNCGLRPRIGVRGDNIADWGQTCLAACPSALGRAKYAKQTQFGGESCKTNPIRPTVRNKPNFRRPRYPTLPVFHYSSIPIRRQSCETNPIWAVGVGTGAIEHAKRTQYAPAERNRWGRLTLQMGAIAPNKPNSKRSFKFEVSSVKLEKPAVRASNFPLQTSAGARRDFLYKQSQSGQAGRRSRRRRVKMCETNPIWAVGVGTGAIKHAKRTQSASHFVAGFWGL